MGIFKIFGKHRSKILLKNITKELKNESIATQINYEMIIM